MDVLARMSLLYYKESNFTVREMKVSGTQAKMKAKLSTYELDIVYILQLSTYVL
jgi:hypothetical protein